MLQLVKNLLAKKMRVNYNDVEKGVKENMLKSMVLDKDVSNKLGDPFLFVRPNTFAEIDEIFGDMIDPKKKEDRYDVIIVDSITSLIATKSLDRPIEEIEIGVKSRLTSTLLEKWKSRMRVNGVTMFLVNQMRTKIGIGYGQKTTDESSGGKALEFYPDIRLRMRAGPVMKREEKTFGGVRDVVYGNEAVIWSVKNRATRPMIEVSMPVLYGKGISNVLTVRDVLKEQGVLKHSHGGNYTIAWKGGEVKIDGMGKVIEWVRENITELKEFMKKEGMLNLTAGSDSIGL